MGTVLSISPTSRKVAILHEGPETNWKSLKKPSVLVSIFTWKKICASAKKSTKKVNPLQPQTNGSRVEQQNNENLKKAQQPESNRKAKLPVIAVTVTVPTQPIQPSETQVDAKQLRTVQKQPSNKFLLSPRRVVVQGSTGELLRCLGEFMCRRCFKLKNLTSNETILWFRNVDRTLLTQGWQDQGFITPANLVFVYLLCKETVTDDVDSSRQLQGTFLICLYMAYSYMGNEISYPLKPFMIEANKETFWNQCLDLINKMSDKMLRLNLDPEFFTEIFQDLKNEGGKDKVTNDLDR